MNMLGFSRRFKKILKTKTFSELRLLYGKMLVSSNPAFLAYLGLPISHIRQNPKNARFFLFILFFPYFPYYPLRVTPFRGPPKNQTLFRVWDSEDRHLGVGVQV